MFPFCGFPFFAAFGSPPRYNAAKRGFFMFELWKKYKIRKDFKKKNLFFILETPYKSCTYEQLQQAQTIAKSYQIKLTDLIKH